MSGPWILTALALVGRGAAVDFERVQLASEFTCEGASFADFDRDGALDVVAGPRWYRGPSFEQSREIYAPRAFDPAGYSDNFFAFPRDFDGDGWVDVLFVGFPGESAAWYRNPAGAQRLWERFQVFDHVDNESPAFTDLIGDGTPELVCLYQGRLGWAGPERVDPRKPWSFHALSEDLSLEKFTHGLGVGDVDGDGRADVLLKHGWWQQPASLAGDPPWTHHPFAFSSKHGGAQMYVYDVDGDGDGDVITSLAAHEFGLSWWEQVERDGARDFVEHRIMDDEPSDNVDGVRFGELHALDLADVDGDGLKDIVTGKRWWSHGAKGDPEPGSLPVVYWFRLSRSAPGAPGSLKAPVRYVPHLVDDGSGVGVQVVAGDVTGDGKVDVVVGNKRGVFVLRQQSAPAPPQAPKEQPEKSQSLRGPHSDFEGPLALRGASPQDAGELPRGEDGRVLNFDFETGALTDWTLDGSAFAGQPVAGDTVSARGREPSLHQGRFWIGGYEVHGDGGRGRLISAPFRVTRPWASFLVGGGSFHDERVELVRAEDEQVLFRTSAADFESLQRVLVDLRGEQGELVFVRIVDDNSGGWGHVNFDDFRLHAEKPSFARPPGVPEILAPDAIENAGLPADVAARAMTLPDGFQVEVVAAEPDLHQPIAFTIDGKGRIWVIEAFSYPQKRAQGAGLDDVVVFEDTDGDGRCETRTVFAQGINLASGIEVGFGGVVVGAAPELLFYPDRNDDLVPDGPPEVLLDGWGYEDTHETLNAFTWGPDGWLYGCHGVFTHSRVGAPGTKDERRTPIDAGVWRYHPTKKRFEVFAWGTSNPWGIDFDDRGQAFITACVIPHLYHVIQGARYERQSGSHFDPYVYDEIRTIADHRHYLGSNPHGSNLRSSASGGGHAHCGALVYLGTAFPQQYQNSLFTSNIHGNRINNDRLERAGSGFVGRHADDFLLANDAWFRGINLEQGPDGAVYLIDWYDAQACHWSEIERWDRTNGRLYRVTYGPHRPVKVDIGALSDAELVALQANPDDWYVRRARLALQERAGGGRGRELLARELARAPTQERALRALWALHAAGGLTRELALAELASPHEYVQAWAVQLLLEDRDAPPDVVAALAELAHRTPSPVVRLYLASALQRLRLYERWDIALALARHGEDAADPNLPQMLWYGIEPLVPAHPERALALAREARIPSLARHIWRRAAAQEIAHDALVRALAAEDDEARRATLLAEAASALRGRRAARTPAAWSELYPALRDDAQLRDDARIVALAFGDPEALAELRAVAVDAARTAEQRAQALDACVAARDPELAPLCAALLAEPELRGRALRALAQCDDPATPQRILALYGTLDTAEKRDALNTLSSRAEYSRALLAAVEEGGVPASDVGAFALRNLRNLKDPEVDKLLAATFASVRDTSAAKQRRIDELKGLLDAGALAAADRSAGREVFARTCVQCHALFGEGGDLAPELTGSNRKDLDYLVSNLVDPSAVVGADYQAWMVWTKDERLVTGLLVKDAADEVVLRTENDTIAVAREDVAELAKSELSTMPEGQVDSLTPLEIVALVAYLQGDEQVPLPAGLDLSQLFDGRSLAGWKGESGVWSVENGEIVGRTAGLAHNSFLVNERELGDFTLTFEVRLVGDQGNSGVQFRTRPRPDGEVEGYQADVGPGWWGALYEENGRGLLAESRCAAQVIPDGWNSYRIEAKGHRIRTWINGERCIELEDPEGASRGVVALQVHSGGPTEVRVRRLSLERAD